MQRFLQLRLGCHALPIATGRLAGADHMPRAHRVCLACNSRAVGNERRITEDEICKDAVQAAEADLVQRLTQLQERLQSLTQLQE